MSLPFVSIRGTYTFRADGAVIVSDSTLRFRSRDEVKSTLAAHGYRALDVREAPDRPGANSYSLPSARLKPTDSDQKLKSAMYGVAQSPNPGNAGRDQVPVRCAYGHRPTGLTWATAWVGTVMMPLTVRTLMAPVGPLMSGPHQA